MQRDLLLLNEIIEAAARIEALVGELTAAAIEADALRRDALLWNYTVLGEAAAQLSAHLTEANPAIPWSRPIGLRNRIVHGYWSIDLEILVNAARADVPSLAAQVRDLRDQLG